MTDTRQGATGAATEAPTAVPALQIGDYSLASRLIMGTGGITDLAALEKRGIHLSANGTG